MIILLSFEPLAIAWAHSTMPASPKAGQLRGGTVGSGYRAGMIAVLRLFLSKWRFTLGLVSFMVLIQMLIQPSVAVGSAHHNSLSKARILRQPVVLRFFPRPIFPLKPSLHLGLWNLLFGLVIKINRFRALIEIEEAEIARFGLNRLLDLDW